MAERPSSKAQDAANDVKSPAVDSTVLTLDEAAERLRMGLRGFRDWINRNPTDSTGVPLYFMNGNRKLFTERDIERIIQTLRGQEQSRLALLKPTAKRSASKRRTGTENDSKFAEAMRLTRDWR